MRSSVFASHRPDVRWQLAVDGNARPQVARLPACHVGVSGSRSNVLVVHRRHQRPQIAIATAERPARKCMPEVMPTEIIDPCRGERSVGHSAKAVLGNRHPLAFALSSLNHIGEHKWRTRSLDAEWSLIFTDAVIRAEDACGTSDFSVDREGAHRC